MCNMISKHFVSFEEFDTIFLEPATKNEMITVSADYGHDGVTSKLKKIFHLELLDLLITVTNKSFSSGVLQILQKLQKLHHLSKVEVKQTVVINIDIYLSYLYCHKKY